jgi:hypothetical protein
MRMSVGGNRGHQGGGDHESSDAGVDGHETAAKALAKPI